MAEPERVDRPGDHEVDLNRLIADALRSADFGRKPSFTEVERVVEVVSVLLEGRDAEIERLRDKAANAVANQATLKGLSVEEGAVVLELGSPRELVIAWVDAARKLLVDAENYSETRVDFPAVSMELKAAGELERYVFTVQRAGKLTPHEAREQAEAERDGANGKAAEYCRLYQSEVDRVAELTRERDEARSELWRQVELRVEESNVEFVEQQRDAALELVTEVLDCWGREAHFEQWWAKVKELRSGRPVAQETPDSSDPGEAWMAGWSRALEEVDAWAQRQVEQAQKYGEEGIEQAFQACSSFAVMARNDPTAPGRLADNVERRAVVAQEAGIPPKRVIAHGVGCLRAERGQEAPCICGAKEAGEPPVPRVWRKGDPEPQLCGATEGATGIDCTLIRFHSLDVDHQGTANFKQAAAVGYPLFVRWPWQQYDLDYATLVLPEGGDTDGE